MNRSTPGVTPLRQRMLEDMHLRKLEPKTQSTYVRAVRRLAEYLGRSPDSAWCGRLEPTLPCTASTALSELGCHESVPATCRRPVFAEKRSNR